MTLDCKIKYRNTELKKLLDTKQVFKLICGANNENYEEITKLVSLYSNAGVKFFDINASKGAIEACRQAIKNPENSFICVSVGTKNDPHMAKCRINSNCISCKLCKDVCPQGAIEVKGNTMIYEKKCIGCKKCLTACKNNAIESYQKELQLERLLNDIKEADCIEFHIITDNKEEIISKWQYLTDNYDGFLSIALNRSLFSDKDMFEILSTMIDIAKNKGKKDNLMIQADGKSMSGGVDDYNSTLQAVSTADTLIKLGFNDIPIIISGGTNSKSLELARLCRVDINGVAIGSYARKIVRDYLNSNDNYENALSKAKKLTSD